MLDDSFKTIKAATHAELKIQRSRFIATAIPCLSKKQAEQQIAEIARQYHDASHHCFAYRIRCEQGEPIFHYSDAGEPSGTAGRPIYDTIISFKLFNICVVVTRYFGGIKLGTGGLTHAYRDSAKAILEKAEIQTELILERYRVIFPLNLTKTILHLLATEGIFIRHSSYTSEVELLFDVRLSKIAKLIESIASKTNGKVKPEKVS